MVTCVHDSVGGRGANREYPLPPSKSKHCTWTSLTHILSSFYLRPFHVSPCRKNGVRAYTSSSGGGGLKNKYPNPRQVQSCHVPPHAAFNKSWLNKQAVLADPFAEIFDFCNALTASTTTGIAKGFIEISWSFWLLNEYFLDVLSIDSLFFYWLFLYKL